MSWSWPDPRGLAARALGRRGHPAPEPAELLNACAGTERLSLAFVGNELLEVGPQQPDHDIGFGTVWRQAAAFLSRGDIAVANLEGQVAPGRTWMRGRLPDPWLVVDGVVYPEFPFYTYHPGDP